MQSVGAAVITPDDKHIIYSDGPTSNDVYRLIKYSFASNTTTIIATNTIAIAGYNKVAFPPKDNTKFRFIKTFHEGSHQNKSFLYEFDLKTAKYKVVAALPFGFESFADYNGDWLNVVVQTPKKDENDTKKRELLLIDIPDKRVVDLNPYFEGSLVDVVKKQK